MVRSDPPNVDRRLGRRLASKRKGSSNSKALDLPDPFWPRNSRRPWWKVKVSS